MIGLPALRIVRRHDGEGSKRGLKEVLKEGLKMVSRRAQRQEVEGLVS